MGIDGQPWIQIFKKVEKVPLPSRKALYRVCYRVCNEAGVAVVDYVSKDGEAAPEPGLHLPHRPSHNAHITMHRAQNLYSFTDLAIVLVLLPRLRRARVSFLAQYTARTLP